MNNIELVTTPRLIRHELLPFIITIIIVLIIIITTIIIVKKELKKGDKNEK